MIGGVTRRRNSARAPGRRCEGSACALCWDCWCSPSACALLSTSLSLPDDLFTIRSIEGHAMTADLDSGALVALFMIGGRTGASRTPDCLAVAIGQSRSPRASPVSSWSCSAPSKATTRPSHRSATMKSSRLRSAHAKPWCTWRKQPLVRHLGQFRIPYLARCAVLLFAALEPAVRRHRQPPKRCAASRSALPMPC